MTLRLLVFTAAVVLAGAASAQGQTASAASGAPQSASAESDRDRIECRKEDISGSRVRKVKVCKSVGEWEMQGRRAQEGWKRANRNAPGAPSKQMTGPGG